MTDTGQSGERRAAIAIGAAVFIAGAVLLGLELAASRVLAPYFGSSLFVWGALIGVVLAGLSLGYWIGGAAADRYPAPRLLLGALASASLLVLAIPYLDGWALERVVSWDPGPRADPLVATILLFGAPSVILGSVTPIAVRLRARSLERLGRTAGRLFAISTAGSIAGTFATAFWLIPALGTDQLLASAALALMVAAAAVAVAERAPVALAVALAAAGALTAPVLALAPESGGRLAGTQLQNWSPLYRLQEEGGRQTGDPGAESRNAGFRIVHAKDTRYHRLVVADDSDTRFLRFDNSFQSAMYLGEPFRTRFEYTDYLDLGLAYNPDAGSVLFIGLGGGSAPKRMWRDFPQLRLQAVELDPEVVDVAYRYFALPRDDRLAVEVEDGRRYLVRHSERWDVIVVDAFYSDAIPFHLATREFLELAHARLEPGGVVVVNVFGALAGDQSRLLRSMLRTYRAVFPTVAVHPVFLQGDRDPRSVRNVILVATDGAAPSTAFLAERWAEIRKRVPAAPDLATAIRERWDRPLATEDVPVLTDDYAPTDALLLLFG